MPLRRIKLAMTASRVYPASFFPVLLIFSVVAFACSRGPIRPCERLSADAIFVGRVLKITPTNHVFQNDAVPGYSGGNETWPGYSMRIEVEDSLKGKLGKEVQIETGQGGGDCGTPLPVGGRFLIFATKNDDGKLWTGLDNTTELKDDTVSASLVESVRKTITFGQASIFGMVSYDAPARYDAQGHVIADPWRRVDKMVIRATSADKTFTTITAPDGQYEFSDLPNGTYTITPALEPGQAYDQAFYSERFVKSVGDGSCTRVDFALRPTTRLKGKVLVPAGHQFAFIPKFNEVLVQTVAAVPVQLQKTTERSGFASAVDTDGSFDIWPIAPGDYYVGININRSPTPEAPFTPTYYPGVTDKTKASVVHVEEGETKYIEMPEPFLAQKRTIHVAAVGVDGKPLSKVRVQWEDLQHPGDSINSSVDLDLDANGSGTMTVYSGITYHLHASYVWLHRSSWCAEPVTVQAGSEPAKATFVMDRVDGLDDRYRNGLASGLCDIGVVDDPRATADIRALNSRSANPPAAPASGPASPPAAPANNKP